MEGAWPEPRLLCWPLACTRGCLLSPPSLAPRRPPLPEVCPQHPMEGKAVVPRMAQPTAPIGNPSVHQLGLFPVCRGLRPREKPGFSTTPASASAVKGPRSQEGAAFPLALEGVWALQHIRGKVWPRAPPSAPHHSCEFLHHLPKGFADATYESVDLNIEIVVGHSGVIRVLRSRYRGEVGAKAQVCHCASGGATCQGYRTGP